MDGVFDLQTIGEHSRGVWEMFESVVEPYRASLWQYCRRLTVSPWDAEDLFQDTLIRAFSSLSSRSHREQTLQTKAFLFRVATNHWIDAFRRMKVRMDPSGMDKAGIASFVALYNQRDFHGLAELLLEDATHSFVVKDSTEYGKRTITSKSLHPDKPRDPNVRVYADTLWGKPALIFMRQKEHGQELFDVNTIEWEDGKIARWKCYYFCRSFLQAAAAHLGVGLSEVNDIF